ncbi:uncharacterized protein F4812DRAFT_462360 [Daldinia caldariorum]|uniref:uncharacterized protein n=1 Tax=Daldinia caldariorum TaxID=326644 RepID=UPI0020080ED0|nr:uncharacterized protein F4812DRAFT_462360 [Daldinia caldariorum]KAI1464648.1 hypothetical protein F4812DRAFT_462360 [Daldinia caldariorum]
MFGRGNIEDAKELQASFTCAKLPRNNKPGQKGKNGSARQQGSSLNNNRQQHTQYGQDSTTQGHVRHGRGLVMDPEGNTRQYHPGRSTREGTVASPGTDSIPMLQVTREPRTGRTGNITQRQESPIPQAAPKIVPRPEPWQKRVASTSEDENIKVKRIKGESTDDSSPLQTQLSNSPSLLHRHPQNSGGHAQTTQASPTSSNQLQSLEPTQSNNNALGPTLARGSNTIKPAFPCNMGPWRESSESIRSDSSSSDSESDSTSLSAIQPIPGNEGDGDVAMSGVEAGHKAKVGLQGSRWNFKNPNHYPEKTRHKSKLNTKLSSGYLWEDSMHVDPPTQERRGPSAPTGQIVMSGISKGPGLADSRWAS